MFSASKTSAPVSGGFQIANSLRFRSSASAYLNRTPSVAGNRQTWTWSGWVKCSVIQTASPDQGLFGALANTSGAYAVNDFYAVIMRWNSGSPILDILQCAGGSVVGRLVTSQVFRDPSAWYHFVIVSDTTNATASNRMRLYVNGTQVTAFSSATYPAQNSQTYINSTNYHITGDNWISGATRNPLNGYMAEVNFIDGQALTPSSFGETDAVTGVWKPKRYSGTYGTNGFRLNFSNGTSTTTLGNDSSGNGNNWTTNNISLTAGSTYDWMIDSPTSYAGTSYGVGNYAVLNPVDVPVPTISGGNLNVTGPDNTALSTIGMSSNKWYCEMTVTTVGAISIIGICGTHPAASFYPSDVPDGYAYLSTGVKRANSTSSSYGASYTSGDIIGCAFDADAGTLTFYKNGVSQGVAFSSIPVKTYYFAIYGRTSTSANNCSMNFGQRPFAFSVPSGYKALNTYNLP